MASHGFPPSRLALSIALVLVFAFSSPAAAAPHRQASLLAGQAKVTPDRAASTAAPPCGGVYPVSADTTTRSAAPDQSYGADTLLQAGRGPAVEDHTLLYFDLPKEVTGAAITHAELVLTLNDDMHTPAYTIQVYSLPAAFDEYKTTWNSQPSPGAGLPPVTYAVPFIDPNTPALLRIDVTSLVGMWSNSQLLPSGMALLPSGQAETQVRFHSRESNGGLYAPRLEVSCAQPYPPPLSDQTALDALQMAGLDKLRQASLTTPTFVVEGGVMRYAEFTLATPPDVANNGTARALWFVQTYGDALRLDQPLEQLQVERRSDDEKYVALRQRQAGIPVYPGQIVVHVEGAQVVGVMGNYVPGLTLPGSPGLSSEQAEQIALLRAGDGATVHGETRLRYVNFGLTMAKPSTTHLAWQVNLRGGPLAVFVDAWSGKVLGENPAERISYQLDIEDVNGAGPSGWCGEWWFTTADDHACDENGCIAGVNPEAARAWWSIRAVDYFYRHYLNRDSLDGIGGEIQLYVNLNWDNAHYLTSGECMEFGMSFTVQDVVGHELTHGVTEHTADLVYANESGALNETFSDVLAELSETPPDWLFGEARPGGASRDFEHPPYHSQPETYHGLLWRDGSDNPDVTNDFGNVHYNSGVGLKAAWLILHGGSFAGHDFTQPLGVAKGAWLYYRTLQSLSANSVYMDMRRAAINVAINSIRPGSTFTTQDVCTVRNAFHAVGLGESDIDCDGLEDNVDPDADADGVPDSVDNCDSIANPGQQDADLDSVGDACDSDDDADGKYDIDDNCPVVYNPDQADWNNNGAGDACEDGDADGYSDARDNCPALANADQRDIDRDGLGDACDDDADADGLVNTADNCRWVPNADQANDDGDSYGDACDLCGGFYAKSNIDSDRDGLGDACDADADNDGILDDGDGNGVRGDHPCAGGETVSCDDNCSTVKNLDQADWNGDGIGGACQRNDIVGYFGVPSSTAVHLTQAAPLRFELAPACTACLSSGYVVPYYRQEVMLNVDTPFYAEVVDTDGRVVASTSAQSAGLTQSLRFAPAPYAFPGLALSTAHRALATVMDTPADSTTYYVELYPLMADPQKRYHVTATTHETVGEPWLYLPMLKR